MIPVSPEVERYVRELFDKFPCHKREGMKLEEVGVGEVVVSVTVRPEHTTCYKTLQGGYINVFTDSPMWMTLMTDPSLWGLLIYTKEFPHTDFSKFVKIGENLKIHARHADTYLDKNGALYYLSAAEVKNSKGDLIAMVRALNKLGISKKRKKVKK